MYPEYVRKLHFAHITGDRCVLLPLNCGTLYGYLQEFSGLDMEPSRDGVKVTWSEHAKYTPNANKVMVNSRGVSKFTNLVRRLSEDKANKKHAAFFADLPRSIKERAKKGLKSAVYFIALEYEVCLEDYALWCEINGLKFTYLSPFACKITWR